MFLYTCQACNRLIQKFPLLTFLKFFSFFLDFSYNSCKDEQFLELSCRFAKYFSLDLRNKKPSEAKGVNKYIGFSMVVCMRILRGEKTDAWYAGLFLTK